MTCRISCKVNGNPEVTQFLPYATWQALPDARSWLERMQKITPTGAAKQLVIVRNDDKKVTGAVFLFKFEVSSRLELGYATGRACWKQGYAAEPLRALPSNAFALMHIRRMEAEINPNNIASNALLRPVGFSQEGYLRERWSAMGSTYGVNAYGLLASELPSAT